MFNVIIVNTTADENGTNPAAGSLREAIIAANANDGGGGQNSGVLTVNQCVITGNTAGGNGGGGIQNFGTLNLNQSTLAGKAAQGSSRLRRQGQVVAPVRGSMC